MRVRIIVRHRRALNWLNIKYTRVHAIQKYGPVAQPGRVPDFYHIGRNPAVSGSNPDGPVMLSVLFFLQGKVLYDVGNKKTTKRSAKKSTRNYTLY